MNFSKHKCMHKNCLCDKAVDLSTICFIFSAKFIMSCRDSLCYKYLEGFCQSKGNSLYQRNIQKVQYCYLINLGAVFLLSCDKYVIAKVYKSYVLDLAKFYIQDNFFLFSSIYIEGASRNQILKCILTNETLYSLFTLHICSEIQDKLNSFIIYINIHNNYYLSIIIKCIFTLIYLHSSIVYSICISFFNINNHA